MSTKTTKNALRDEPLTGEEIVELDQLGAAQRDADLIEATVRAIREAGVIELLTINSLEPADAEQAMNFPAWVWSTMVEDERREHFDDYVSWRNRYTLDVHRVTHERADRFESWLETNWAASDPALANWVTGQLDLVKRLYNQRVRNGEGTGSFAEAHRELAVLQTELRKRNLDRAVRSAYVNVEQDLQKVLTTLAETSLMELCSRYRAGSRPSGVMTCTFTVDSENVDKLSGLNALAAETVARVGAIRKRIELEKLRASSNETQGWFARRAAARRYCAELRAI